MPGHVNGFTLAYAATGAVVMWSGIKGETVSDTFRGLLSGQAPAGGQEPIASMPTPYTASTGSTGSTAPAGGNPSGGTPSANQAIGRTLAATYGWATGAEWTALNNIIMAESGWKNDAQNPNSTAYGIFQFLDTTWASVGYSKTSNATTQIAAGLKYIKQRYGDPIKAWSFHMANGWY